jgi:hypothetical protein
MLRKSIQDYRLITDGWVSRDPADDSIIEGVYKKNLHEGEERLMLAVLESAVLKISRRMSCKASKRKEVISVNSETRNMIEQSPLAEYEKSLPQALQNHGEIVNTRSPFHSPNFSAK